MQGERTKGVLCAAWRAFRCAAAPGRHWRFCRLPLLLCGKVAAMQQTWKQSKAALGRRASSGRDESACAVMSARWAEQKNLAMDECALMSAHKAAQCCGVAVAHECAAMSAHKAAQQRACQHPPQFEFRY